MTTAQLFLDSSRRQILHLAGIGLSILALIFVAIDVVMLVLKPTIGLAIFCIVLLLFVFAAGLTLSMLRNRQAAQAVIPISIGLFVVIGTVGLLLPALAQPAAPYLAINVLIVTLSGNRHMALRISILSLLLAAIIVSGLPRPFPDLNISAMVEPVKIIAAGTFVLVIWLISSSLFAAQTTALALSDQRAAEAEAARVEAEAARSALEYHSAEQARLLDLVRTLELPILSIGEGLMVMPLVGRLDQQRLGDIQQRLFNAVIARQTQTLVLDMTGIDTIDQEVAKALLQMIEGVRLLGAQSLMSGIRAEVAQTLAMLDLDMASIRSFANLGQALMALG